MTSRKTVLFEETETVMSRTMQIPIFRIPETQDPLLCEDDLEFEDRNPILNLKLSIFGEEITDFNQEFKQRLLLNEEPEVLFRSLIAKNSKEFKKRIRRSSKSCKSYICSRKLIPDSNDENFWRSAMNDCNSVGTVKKTWEAKKETSKETDFPSLGKDSDSDDVYIEEINAENIFSGNIKVTIKDKPIVQTREEVLETLKICFEAFKINAQESRRLQELKTKIQEKMAKRRLRRCFDAWRHRVTNVKALERKKKEEREMSNERKIELFINAIVEKQKELSRQRKSATNCTTINKCETSQRCQSAPDKITDNSSSSRNPVERNSLRRRCKSNSQTRLQVQKKIIEEQRFKLAEQNRIIEEMRLIEIERDARRANKETMDAAKGVLAHCGRRTRRSLTHLMRENGCRDEFLETLRVPNTPDFLVRMEARAEARRERVKKSEEARLKKIEDEKRKEEEARKKEELERKRLQREAQREAKRLREEREEKRIREIERIKLLNEKADQFYNRLLLRRYIFEPLISLLNQKYNYTEKATNHYNETLLRKTLIAWKLETNEQNKIKEELAISVYQRNLLWASFSDWRKYTSEERQKYHVASDFYDMKVQSKILKTWWLRTIEIKALKKEKEEIAKEHYEWRLKMRFFSLWRRFPEISAEVKESERQREEWRGLVQRVIPDFNPKQRGVAIGD